MEKQDHEMKMFCHWWEWQEAHIPLNSSCDNVKLHKIPNNVCTQNIHKNPKDLNNYKTQKINKTQKIT
jgi:hypothetical protein